jgi:pimeloyl-ACP methyl ester carboxylesterase
MTPTIRYAKSGNVHIAYQVIGSGPFDLVFVTGWISHLELQWDDPAFRRILERLAGFSRLITFDKRGTGLSDRVSAAELPTLEQRMQDMRAVMDAANSQRAAIFGVSEGGPMCALFAATYPERTSALIMYGTYARWIRDPDTPWMPTRDEHEKAMEAFERGWGSTIGLRVLAPSVADDKIARDNYAKLFRAAASPGAGVALYRMNIEIDVRQVLPAIRVPTLIVHRTGDKLIDFRAGRYMASVIPGAKYVELPGEDHLIQAGDSERIIDEVAEFLTGSRQAREPDRVLATVLFTDIVDSTVQAGQLGDARWNELLQRYYAAVRGVLAQYRGREIDTAGDGFFATFDGPARAVRCAKAIREALSPLGIAIRAGLHTGECEISGEKLAGVAVHIGARVASMAGPGEIVVSSTVKDLVAGSGLIFSDRGLQSLKGIAEKWRLFLVD